MTAPNNTFTPYQYNPINWGKEKQAVSQAQKAYRVKNERYVLEIKINPDEETARYIRKLFDKVYHTSNQIINKCQNKIEALQQNHEYQHCRTEYNKVLEKIKKTADPDMQEKLESERERIARKMNKLVKKYGLQEEQIVSRYRKLAEIYEIPADFAESRARDISKGVSSVLYGTGKKLHYLEKGDYPALKGCKYDRALAAHLDDNGDMFLTLYRRKSQKNTPAAKSKNREKWLTIKIEPSKNDQYVQDELNRVKEWLTDPKGHNLHDLLYSMLHDNCRMNTGRLCYTSLVKRGEKLYAQLTIEGHSTPKKKKRTNQRRASGKAGIDIGTQTAACYSDNDFFLVNLAEAPGDGYDAKARKRKLTLIERAMDRSRRATNPDNYNEDGTIKNRKDRTPWVKSKNYKRLQEKRRRLLAGDAEYRRNCNRAIANRVRASAADLYTEPSNASTMKKRAQKDPEQSNKRRRRFGRSVQSRCPGQFAAELSRKFGAGFNLVDQWHYRASQADHSVRDYKHKALGDRAFYLDSGALVLRDFYSAFILKHALPDLVSIDWDACERDFPRFVACQDALVWGMMSSGVFPKNCGVSARGILVGDSWVSFDEYFSSEWRVGLGER